MIRSIVNAAMLSVVITACTTQSSSDTQTPKVDTTATQTSRDMKNLVSIIEIPVSDLSRAITFYQSILNIKIEEVDMGDTKMGVLPNEEKTVNVVLVKGGDYKPSTDGTVAYLNGGDDLQPTLDKVTSNGGQVIVPKTEISPEMGFFAMFIDSEGNKLGLHSIH